MDCPGPLGDTPPGILLAVAHEATLAGLQPRPVYASLFFHDSGRRGKPACEACVLRRMPQAGYMLPTSSQHAASGTYANLTCITFFLHGGPFGKQVIVGWSAPQGE